VVPIGRYLLPSAYRKWKPSTRTGPFACDGTTSTVPWIPSSERAVDRVVNDHVPADGGRYRTAYRPSPS